MSRNFLRGPNPANQLKMAVATRCSNQALLKWLTTPLTHFAALSAAFRDTKNIFSQLPFCCRISLEQTIGHIIRGTRRKRFHYSFDHALRVLQRGLKRIVRV